MRPDGRSGELGMDGFTAGIFTFFTLCLAWAFLLPYIR